MEGPYPLLRLIDRAVDSSSTLCYDFADFVDRYLRTPRFGSVKAKAFACEGDARN
jgi:hypothetical protein